MKTVRTLLFAGSYLCLLLVASCKNNKGITNEPPQPDPVITDISPDRGKSGAEVTITGMNFGITPEENTLTFNGKNAVVTGSGETELKTAIRPTWTATRVWPVRGSISEPMRIKKTKLTKRESNENSRIYSDPVEPLVACRL